ncbi:hypothetical protein TNCT_487111 [Trichonephila clavata]|uniref:Uncharacterized protein n=1 Tax=Trichonephila clavata TaxID=2740835 RepID=A0A8X6JP69_TRICU|nr:hypothetical protein TNCT_487111 [Trichonephila clavata]
MAKKVNKRGNKAGILQLSVKKDKIISKNKLKKFISDSDKGTESSSFTQRFSRIDGIRPFTIAALAVFFGFCNR